MWPWPVNGIVLSRTQYLAPRQWGIAGKDLFTEAVTAAYRASGMKVSYLDDWETYHTGMGEIHCGTNTLRNASTAWWKHWRSGSSGRSGVPMAVPLTAGERGGYGAPPIRRRLVSGAGSGGQALLWRSSRESSGPVAYAERGRR